MCLLGNIGCALDRLNVAWDRLIKMQLHDLLGNIGCALDRVMCLLGNIGCALDRLKVCIGPSEDLHWPVPWTAREHWLCIGPS